MVEELFTALPLDLRDERPGDLGPITARMLGIARGSGGIEEYRQHLVEKYLGDRPEPT